MQPQPESGDFIGGLLFALTIAIGLVSSMQRGKTLGHFFQRIAKFAGSKDAHELPLNVNVSNQAVLLAVDVLNKRDDDRAREMEAMKADLINKLRSDSDSTRMVINHVRREIRDGFADVYSKIDVTNRNVNDLGNEFREFKLSVLSSKNGNGKTHDEGGET